MDIEFRSRVEENDKIEIRAILESTQVFYPFEIDIAIEILDTFRNQGESSGYKFIIAERDGEIMGYINYGPIPCTVTSWDIYWIAVKKDSHNLGLGTRLMKMAEKDIADGGGKHIWVETSSRKDYEPTREFYKRKKYRISAELKDFYSDGDNKIIFHKKLQPNR